MNFRKLRGVNLPYREQGLIWFTCKTYKDQPPAIKKKIRDMCKDFGGEYAEALFVMLTRENISVPWIEEHYFVSHALLYERRKRIYENWKHYTTKK